MNTSEKPIEKVYWKIAEVAEMINISQSNLRYWESKFYWINPKRNRKNERLYKMHEIDALTSINLLVNELGMTLDGVSKAHEFVYDIDLEEVIKNNVNYGKAIKIYKKGTGKTT